MATQVRRRLRAAVPGEVARRAHRHHAQHAQLARMQATVGQLAQPHRGVEFLALHIGAMVGHHKLDVDVRIALHEGRHHRHQVRRAELGGATDAQCAVDAGTVLGEFRAGQVDVRQGGFQSRMESQPRRAGLRPPRGALDQLHAQLVLQRRQRAAHRLQRAMQVACGGAEVALLHHGDEDPVVVQSGHVELSRLAR